MQMTGSLFLTAGTDTSVVEVRGEVLLGLNLIIIFAGTHVH